MQSEGGVSDLGQNQLVSLQSKFRCKRDLYSYLDQKVSACLLLIDVASEIV